MRVLVTGAAGSIGQVVTVGLARRGHEVVALDRAPEPPGNDLPFHTVDCADTDAVSAVVGEVSPEAVVHLAGYPDETGLLDALASHVVTTAAVLDAMVEHDVRRLVHASSNHAVGRTPRRELLTVDTRPRPDTFYGVGKVAAEALLSLYADRYGLDLVACRIGSFGPRPETVRQLSTWLSPDDCVRMVDAGLTATAPGFAVLYGISANTRAWWDLDPGRSLGYVPQDDAEDFASLVAPSPEDDWDGAHVGGPFATSTYDRPALDRHT